MKLLIQIFIIAVIGGCLFSLGRILNHFPLIPAQPGKYQLEDLYIDYIDYSYFGVVYEAVRWENALYLKE